MKHETSQDMINRLDVLLEQERESLLNGNLAAVGESIEEKEALIATIATVPSSPRHELQNLSEKIARNQALFDGALQGIKKVAARVAAVRKARESMATYDQNGQKRTIPGKVARRLEKRA